MRMPGFTAEAAVDKPMGFYLTVPVAMSTGNGRSVVQPQQIIGEECYEICGLCVNGRQFCRMFCGPIVIWRGWVPC
jgi:hypothetical protein